jgi:hypothetical protein
MSGLIPPHVKDVMDALTQKPSPSECPDCDCIMHVINLTFFTLGPDSSEWVVQTLFCPNCELTDTSKFMPLAEC